MALYASQVGQITNARRGILTIWHWLCIKQETLFTYSSRPVPRPARSATQFPNSICAWLESEPYQDQKSAQLFHHRSSRLPLPLSARSLESSMDQPRADRPPQ